MSEDPTERAVAERIAAARRESERQQRTQKKWERAQRRRARGQRIRPVLTVALIFGLIAGASWFRLHQRSTATGTQNLSQVLRGDTGASSAAVRIRGGQPPAGLGSATSPIGHPAPPPVGTGDYVFFSTQASGQPVAYDPCRPVHVSINPAGAPTAGEELIRQALAEVSADTGLEFIVDGPTDERFGPDRALYQRARYGDRWAPVLITWSDETETPELAGPTTGLGGSNSVDLPRGRVYLTGAVTLDRVDVDKILRSADGPANVRAVIEHELGHVVGLDHVADPTQLMNPELEPGVTSFGDGDRRGLALLGQGACFPEI